MSSTSSREYLERCWEDTVSDRFYIAARAVDGGAEDVQMDRREALVALANKRHGIAYEFEAPSPPMALAAPEPLYVRDLTGTMTKSKYMEIVFRDPNLTDAQKVLLSVLVWKFSRSKPLPLSNCFPKLRTILKATGRPDSETSERSLRRIIKKTIEMGWLRSIPFRGPDGKRRSNGYQFLIPPNKVVDGHPGWQGPTYFSARDKDAIRQRASEESCGK